MQSFFCVWFVGFCFGDIYEFEKKVVLLDSYFFSRRVQILFVYSLSLVILVRHWRLIFLFFSVVG